MANALCLQDWTTIQGSSNTITQNEDSYLEIANYQDVAIYCEVAQVVGANVTSPVNIDVQTSPTKDEVFFAGTATTGNTWVVNFPFTTTASGLQPLQISRWSTTANSPLGKYLRWRVRFSTSSQSITFRLWASLNQAG